MLKRKCARRSILFFAGSLALISSGLARGAAATWSGGGTTAAWDNVKLVGLNFSFPNWGNAAFDPGVNDDVTFGTGFASGNPNLDGSRIVHSVTIDSTQGFSITGSTFAFGALTRTTTSSGTQTFSVPVQLNGNSVWSIDGAGALVMSNSVGEAIVGSALNKTGAAQLTLGAGPTDTTANSWTGLTTISAGTVLLNKADGTDAIASNIRINGGTLRLNNSDQIDDSSSLQIDSGTLDLEVYRETIAALAGIGGTIATGGTTAGGLAGSLTVNQSTNSIANCSFTGFGLLDKRGAGTLNIKSSGTLGGFETDAGILSVAGNYNLSAGTVLAVNGGAMTINDSSTITLGAVATTAYADSGGTLNINGSHTTIALPFQTLAGIGGNGTININAATVNVGTFLGASFSSGSTGTININNAAQVTVPNLFASAGAGSTGTINISDPGTLVTVTNYLGIGGSDSSAADVGGTGTVYVSNSASLTTPYLNFYSSNLSALIVNQATVTAGQIQELGNGVGRIEISDGSTSALVLGGNSDFTYNGIISDYTAGISGSLTKTGADTLTLTDNNNSFTGPVYINGGTISVAFIADSGNPSQLGAGSQIVLGGGTLDCTDPGINFSDRAIVLRTADGGTIEVDGQLQSFGNVTYTSSTPASLLKMGSGELNVLNVSAGTIVIYAGQLFANTVTASNLIMSSLTLVTVGDGSTFTGTIMDEGTLLLAGSLSTGQLAGNGTVELSSSGLTIGTSNFTFTFAGSLTDSSIGSGALTKTGTGIATLSGANTYTGTTTISAGTLVLNNSLTTAGAAITVSSGATLSASGFLQREILGTGTLSADGSLFVGNLNVANGYAFPGTLAVGSNSVQLLSPTSATLGISTTLSDGGHLTSIGGLTLPTNDTFSSSGNAIVTGPLINSGSVSAASGASDMLTFNDNVSGAGSFSGNLHFQKVFAPSGIVSAAAITLDSTSVVQLSATTSLTANSILNNGQFLQGGGSVSIGGAISGAGVISISAGTLAAKSITQTGLEIEGGTVGLAKHSNGGGTSLLQGIQISGSGRLDLADDDLIIDYQGASPIAQIRAYLVSGEASGAWDGAGIDSTAVQTKIGTALGYGESAILGLSTFGGISVDSTSVLIGYTWYGDANLDGVVNSADLSMISSAGNTWTQGDFNYDGIVNADDYALFAFGSAASGGANISATLPEPAINLAMLSGFCLLIGQLRKR